MKDIITKATFGFMMAQLFPGTVAVFATAFTYFALETWQPHGILATADHVLQIWNAATLGQLLFLLGLCVGAGMFIHGLHWASLGALEFRFQSVFDSYWHDRRLIWQVLLGPIKLIRENAELFLQIRGIRNASIEENVARIDKDHVQQFEFVEDFYLYSAQFFAHTAYALFAVGGAVMTYIVLYGITPRRCCLLLLAHILTGMFFVLGRIQLRTMFLAETQIGKLGTHELHGSSSANEPRALVA